MKMQKYICPQETLAMAPNLFFQISDVASLASIPRKI
jgi:hypothetical protein